MSQPGLQSRFALRVYQHVYHGTDKLLGVTQPEGEAQSATVALPNGARWYVRHEDAGIVDTYLPTLCEELSKKDIPGISLASCVNVSAVGMRQLASVQGLVVVDLFNTLASDDTVEALAELPKLAVLNLSGTAITSRSMATLARMPALQYLNLGWTVVDDTGLAALKDSRSVSHLDLRHTAISNAGLAQLTGLKTLRSLDIQSTACNDHGVEALLPLANQLHHLYMGYTATTNAATTNLKRFSELRTLMLRATQVDRDQDAQLHDKLSQLGTSSSGPEGIQEGLIR